MIFESSSRRPGGQRQTVVSPSYTLMFTRALFKAEKKDVNGTMYKPSQRQSSGGPRSHNAIIRSLNKAARPDEKRHGNWKQALHSDPSEHDEGPAGKDPRTVQFDTELQEGITITY